MDNPFRPDGDLSREADELVELLKGGRPISEVLKNKDELQKQDQVGQLGSSPTQRNPADPSSPSSKSDSTDGGRVNGSVTDSSKKGGKAAEAAAGSPGLGGSVEVQRGVVPTATPGEISQVEHVVIKKKSKCQCCVIQ